MRALVEGHFQQKFCLDIDLLWTIVYGSDIVWGDGVGVK